MIFWVALLTRVYYLSIKSNSYYETLSQKNTIRKDYIMPVRGVIYDRNGELLANNRLGFSISIKPHLSNRSNIKRLKEEIAYISDILEYDPETLLKRYKSQDSIYNHNVIEVVSFLPYDEMVSHHYKFSFHDNIIIAPSIKRYYPNGDIASHVIGYIAKANKKDFENNPTSKITKIVGKSGIEKYYNEYLQGVEGYKKSKVTAFNEDIGLIEQKLPDDNHDLTLTIDLRLQKFIHELYKEKSGAIIVMDLNGELLAAGSFPEYDLNIFINGVSSKEWRAIRDDLNHPFTNKIVNGLYPPGSIVKMGVGLSFLQNGITKYDAHYCTGSFEYGKRNFRCWKDKGHERVSLSKAIKESCDDYFYKGSLKVGIDNISETLTKMGLGKKTGVDLPNEFYGVVPNKDWKRNKYNKSWYVGETLISSIGQGYTLATPLQVTNYTALIASGTLATPHFIKSKRDETVPYENTDVFTESEKKNLPFIRKAMYRVCNEPHGTATNYLRIKRGIKVAGKTGTAQVVSIPQSEKVRMKEHELEYYHRSHAWLSIYFPYNNPKYAITIMNEHGGHGGAATGGDISKIVNYMRKLGY
jgi:penicillin-binding protein 2